MGADNKIGFIRQPDFLDNFHPLTPDEKIDDAKKLVAGYRAGRVIVIALRG